MPRARRLLHWAMVHHELAAVVLFLVIGIVTLRPYQYLINPDLISYLTIAERYLHGNTVAAVSAYWSPLFSWLLAPLLAVGLDPLTAVRGLLVATGCFLMLGTFALARHFTIEERAQQGISFVMIPLTLFVIRHATPDPLLTVFLLLYLAILFDPHYLERRWSGMWCGAIGAAAYLTKSYAFPFFLSHFTLLTLMRCFLEPRHRRSALQKFLGGILVFLAITGPWIALISAREGHLTIGTSAAFNYLERGPRAAFLFTEGLREPPSNSALSAWDDPQHAGLPAEHLRTPGGPLTDLASILAHNTVNMLLIFLLLFTPLSIAILLACVVLSLPPWDERARRVLLFSTVTFFLFALGYLPFSIAHEHFVGPLPFHLAERYFWILWMLLLLMGGHVFSLLIARASLSHSQRNLLLFLFCASFVATHVSVFVRDFHLDRNIDAAAKRLAQNPTFRGATIASDHWRWGAWAAYRMGGKFYGSPRIPTTDQEKEEELRRFGVEYYLVWKDPPPNFHTYREVGLHGLARPLIYRRSGTQDEG